MISNGACGRGYEGQLILAGTIQRASVCVFNGLRYVATAESAIFRAVIVFPILFLFDHLRSSLSSLTRQGR